VTAIEKRKPLTRRQVMQLMLDQEGKCACGCGVKLNPMTEGVIDEHRVPLALGGSNDLDNRHLYRKPCAIAKTGKGGDLTVIAKAKRQAGETGQRARREARGGGSIVQHINPWPPKGSQKLPKRPFEPSRAGFSRGNIR
jgi:5-methylcytosine-specific restriction endonuclease McrA